MKKFLMFTGLGLGLSVGGGFVYAFTTSLVAQFITVGFGAALFSVLVVWITATVILRPVFNGMGQQRNTYRDEPRYYLNGTGQGPQVLPPGGDFYQQNYIPANRIGWDNGSRTEIENEEIIG